MTVRVAVADDEALIRVGVAAILSAGDGIEVVGEAVDGHDAVEFVRRHRVDVLLMDIQMPRLDGVAATEEIRRADLPTRVLILTTFGTDENLRRCLAAGADGFMLKASPPADLIAAVHAVAEGGAVIAPRVARFLLSSFQDLGRPRRRRAELDDLSDRETEVLALLSHGRSNAEIAAALHLTEGTVKGYVSSILATLSVANRVQAALIGYEAGLAGDADTSGAGPNR